MKTYRQLKEYMTRTMETTRKELEVQLNNTVSMRERERLLWKARQLDFAVLYSNDHSWYVVVDKRDRDNKMMQGDFNDITGTF